MTRQDLLAALDSLLQGIVVRRADEHEFVRFDLMHSDKSDFWLSVYVYEDDEPQITATPRQFHVEHDSGQGAADSRLAFWSLPFERAQFRNDEDMHNRFLDVLSVLLSHRVRVTQRRVGPLYSFHGEYEGASEWKTLGGTSWLRSSGARFLYPEQSEVSYVAEPVKPGATTEPPTTLS